jgi:hypothetical protein
VVFGGGGSYGLVGLIGTLEKELKGVEKETPGAAGDTGGGPVIETKKQRQL